MAWFLDLLSGVFPLFYLHTRSLSSLKTKQTSGPLNPPEAHLVRHWGWSTYTPSWYFSPTVSRSRLARVLAAWEASIMWQDFKASAKRETQPEERTDILNTEAHGLSCTEMLQLTSVLRTSESHSTKLCCANHSPLRAAR